jgi:hypothetical protein
MHLLAVLLSTLGIKFVASGHRNADPLPLPLLLIAATLSPTCKVIANIHNYRIARASVLNHVRIIPEI